MAGWNASRLTRWFTTEGMRFGRKEDVESGNFPVDRRCDFGDGGVRGGLRHRGNTGIDRNKTRKAVSQGIITE